MDAPGATPTYDGVLRIRLAVAGLPTSCALSRSQYMSPTSLRVSGFQGTGGANANVPFRLSPAVPSALDTKLSSCESTVIVSLGNLAQDPDPLEYSQVSVSYLPPVARSKNILLNCSTLPKYK